MTPTKKDSLTLFVSSIVPVIKMDNTQERTKEIGSRSYVKSKRTDNTEDMAENIKDELKYNGTYCSVSRFKPIM